MHPLLKWLPLATASLWLGACSNMNNLPPDQMLRQAMQHNLTRDNQYHFEGKVAVESVASASQASDAAAGDQVAVAAASATASGGDITTARVVSTAQSEMAVNAPVQAADDSWLNWIHYWLQHTSIPFSGTVDLPQAKIEIIPELRYQTRQSMLSAKLPLQLDVRNMAAVADVEAILPIIAVSNGSQTLKQMDGRLLLLQAPADWRKPHVINSVWRALPQAVDAGYAALNKQAFQNLPLDEMGRQVRARHRIRLNLDLAQNQQMMAATLANLTQQIQQDAQANQAVTEDYAATLALLQLGREMSNLHNMTGLLLEQDLGRYHTDYYLDRRGRIVAMRQQMPFPEFANALMGTPNQRWHMVSRIRLHYTRQPRFVLQPTADNTVTVGQLFPGLWDSLLAPDSVPE